MLHECPQCKIAMKVIRTKSLKLTRIRCYRCTRCGAEIKTRETLISKKEPNSKEQSSGG